MFFAKNRRFNVFFIGALRTEGKEAKTALSGPDDPRLQRIGHVGFYFAKTGCKIEDEFADIFGTVGCHLGWADGVFCLAFAPGLLKVLQPKEKNGGSHFPWRSHFFSFPYFDFSLMNVYRNTG